jgi:pyroglutamyl-peptidase
MKIIVTGFGRFLDNEFNPTKEVLNSLPSSIGKATLFPIELPVIFDECFDYLRPFIDEIKPDVIIELGLAGGRTSITPERVAINMKDASGPDNIGFKPIDEVIKKDGKNAYFSTLPLREIEDALKESKIPVSISNSAGLYVCNNIMYHVLYYIDQNSLDIKSGFIHVPFSDELKPNKNVFSLPQSTINEAVINIIKTVL